MTTGMPPHSRTRSCTERFSAARIPSRRTRSRLTNANACAALASSGDGPARPAPPPSLEFPGAASRPCPRMSAPSGTAGRFATFPYVMRGTNTSTSRSVSARPDPIPKGGERAPIPKARRDRTCTCAWSADTASRYTKMAHQSGSRRAAGQTAPTRRRRGGLWVTSAWAACPRDAPPSLRLLQPATPPSSGIG